MQKKTTLFALTGIILSCHLCLAACQKEQKPASPQQEMQSSVVDEKMVVVSEIKATGYMRLHGEESYFVEGAIPYTAYFLKDTLAPSSYKFDKKDVQYQLENGYIVKIKDNYFYYPNKKDANVISLTEAKKITKNQKKPAKQQEKGVAGVHFPTDDGFLFENEKQILSRTSDGLVLEHNGHSHFIFYKDLKESKWAYLVPKDNVDKSQPASQSSEKKVSIVHSLDDGYVFDPKDIVAEDANGYTVRHGDHYHYIWKSSLQRGNQQARTGHAETSPLVNVPQASPIYKPNIVEPRFDEEVGGSSTTPTNKKRFPGVDYPTSDGFLFDGNHVQGTSELGLIVGHGTHTHLIPYAHLIASPWESYIPAAYLEKARAEYLAHSSGQDESKKPQEDKKPEVPSEDEALAAKKAYLAESLHVSPEAIKVIQTDAGPAFVYPHGDHSHTILVEKVEIGKPIEDPHGDPHAHQKVGKATLKQLGFDDEVIEDILHATADTPFPADETDPEKMKEWLKTVKHLNIGQRKDPLKRPGLHLMPNIEVLGIGFTPVNDVTPVLQFKKLKQLWMTGTGIKDYSFLKQIPTLEGIDISQNEISDLSFLKDYPHLKVVSAAGNGIKDISTLATLKTLESLNLDHNEVSDLSPLSDLSYLTAISLDNNRLSDLSALQNKKNLTRLYLSKNPDLNLSTLKTENLEELTANESNVKDVQFLKNNPNLTNVTLKDNKISNLKGVEGAKKLVNLDVENNQIDSLKIDDKQESVAHLNVSGNKLKNLEGINDYKALENINASKNEIETLAIEKPNTTLKTIDVSENHIPKEELKFNEKNIPVAIAEHFPAVEGGSIENNHPKDKVVEKAAE
ncbi:pneumococcal-type histidine triad protein [Streptococcus ruminantium]|uniref:pneumococcal-type histidine triad protein n=1 Tax=Streptococcus ruminantium TaxID=1917441 RepID=UPI0012DCD772|nr:pneumococcal-type histidine triad protein [Streptococcus ruminantium]